LNPTTRSETNRWLVLVLVCIAQFMVVLDATIVNVSLPAIQDDLDFTPASLQWVISAYTLIFGGFLLLGGRASDLFGRQPVFLLGLVIFTAASLLNGLAGSSEVLTIGRGLQGFGAALVAPATLSIVTTTFAEGAERGRALSVWSAIAVGGAAFGLILGGILTEYLSWRWIFFVNLPIGIAAFLLSLRYVPNSRSAERSQSVDLAGALTVTSGLIVLVFAIVKAEEYGWGSGRTLGLATLAVVLLASFVVIESRSRSPLIRLGIFRSRSLSVANVAAVLFTSGMTAMFYFSTLYLQGTLGYSAIECGLGFLPFTLGVVTGAALAQQLVPRLGVRATPTVGLILATAGLVLLSRIPIDGSYVTDILPGFLLMSVGAGLTFVPLTLLATTGVAPNDAGLSSGLFNTSQQVGGALGLSVLSTIAASKTSSVLDGVPGVPSAIESAGAVLDGYQLAFVVAALLMVVSLVVLHALLRRRDVVSMAAEGVADVAAL
jgi:EmrB/QacA subfamily drug resistance transporter